LRSSFNQVGENDEGHHIDVSWTFKYPKECEIKLDFDINI
jgi:hypothetical protein